MKAIGFVGSTPIAQYVYARGAAAGKRVQCFGWCQEPHDHHARCRNEPSRRCAYWRRLRFGRRALHGGLGGGSSRRSDSAETCEKAHPARRKSQDRPFSKVQVGMVGINVPIPVPLAYYTFGGWKRSAFGDLNQHGPDAVRFYTTTKAVNCRWPSGLKEGQALRFRLCRRPKFRTVYGPP
jgi:Aldehyde dehydrogenase family